MATDVPTNEEFFQAEDDIQFIQFSRSNSNAQVLFSTLDKSKIGFCIEGSNQRKKPFGANYRGPTNSTHITKNPGIDLETIIAKPSAFHFS